MYPATVRKLMLHNSTLIYLLRLKVCNAISAGLGSWPVLIVVEFQTMWKGKVKDSSQVSPLLLHRISNCITKGQCINNNRRSQIY